MSGLEASINANMTVVLDSIAALQTDVNDFWLLFGAILVFFMQTGFAMLEVGACQTKNTKNILLKNVCDAAFGAICWWAVGYGIAMGAKVDGNEMYGDSGGYWGDVDDGSKSIWLFQWAFAATAATIVSGAVAERITLVAYVTYSIVLTAIVYPVVVFWGWGSGFASAWREEELLGDCGVIDFAGSGVVHLTGGVAAFIGAAIVGPRIGKYKVDEATGKKVSVPLPQQSVSNQTLGTLIIWMGWYGFNGCSTLAISGYGAVAAHGMVATTLSAAAGSIFTMATGKLHKGFIDMDHANNGVLAGLVAITSGCVTTSFFGSLVIGAIASQVYYWSAILVEDILMIDDIVKASCVHGFCGIWGVIAAALFAEEELYAASYYSARAADCAGDNRGNSLGPAITFLIVLIAWVGGMSIIIFGGLYFTGLLRVPEDIEKEGMDDSKHGGAVFTGGPGAAGPPSTTSSKARGGKK